MIDTCSVPMQNFFQIFDWMCRCRTCMYGAPTVQFLTCCVFTQCPLHAHTSAPNHTYISAAADKTSSLLEVSHPLPCVSSLLWAQKICALGPLAAARITDKEVGKTKGSVMFLLLGLSELDLSTLLTVTAQVFPNLPILSLNSKIIPPTYFPATRMTEECPLSSLHR
jgi:hypothetical protein